MNEETVLLHEEGQFVSSARVVLRGTTYSVANLTLVEKRVRRPGAGCAAVSMVLGIFVLLSALGSLLEGELRTSLQLLTFGILVLGFGVLLHRSVKPTYTAVLATSAGRWDAFSSQDEALIDRLIVAINQAMVARG